MERPAGCRRRAAALGWRRRRRIEEPDRWGSPQIITLGVIAVAATAAFLVVEARVAEPVLPLHVFRNRNFSAATGMSFLLGLAMFGALTFLPFYQQAVQHSSATGSGQQLIPLMLGSTVTSLIAGQVTTKTGRCKALPVIGAAIMTFGLYLLTHLGPHTSRLTTGIFFVVLGVGMGFLMQITTLIVQNSVEPRDMGVATSSRTFFQQIGGSIGVSVFGVIFVRRLAGAMSARLPGVHLHASTGSLDPVTINQMPPAAKAAAFFGISHAVDGVFLWTVPAAALVFVLALLLKEVPLRGRAEPASGAPAQPAAGLAEPRAAAR